MYLAILKPPAIKTNQINFNLTTPATSVIGSPMIGSHERNKAQ